MRQRDILDKIIEVTASGAFWIEFFVVVSGSIQWLIASVSADGFIIPQSWTWIHILSGISGLAMAVIEGFAIAFVFGTLAKNKNVFLGILAVAMSVFLIMVIAPSTYARAMKQEIHQVMPNSYVWIWSIAFIASRMLTVASVAWADSLRKTDGVQSEISKVVDSVRAKVSAEYEGRVEQLNTTLSGKMSQLQSELQQAIDEKEATAQWASSLQESTQQLNRQIEELENKLTNAKTTINVQYDDDKKLDKKDRLLELYKVSPSLSQQVAGNIIGVSRQYIGQLLSEFEEEGKIKRNNGSVEVL